MTEHEKSHNGGAYLCPWDNCGQKFVSHNKFLIHYRHKHLGYHWKCRYPNCGKNFSYPNGRRGHWKNKGHHLDTDEAEDEAEIALLDDEIIRRQKPGSSTRTQSGSSEDNKATSAQGRKRKQPPSDDEDLDYSTSKKAARDEPQEPRMDIDDEEDLDE